MNFLVFSEIGWIVLLYNFIKQLKIDIMSEQLITVGEATQALGVTSELPANKCLTKAEFDELVAQIPKVPVFAPNGVYIMHKNRFLVTREKWTYPNNEASGVAVKTDKCAFVIAKEETNMIAWGMHDTLINGILTTTEESVARTDYKGSQNTDAITNQLVGSGTYAAHYCKDYTFLHALKGYLPALGELYEAYQNKSEVDACMSLIGGKALSDNCIKWSSTQYDSSYAWNLDWKNGDIRRMNKPAIPPTYCARPFAAF